MPWAAVPNLVQLREVLTEDLQVLDENIITAGAQRLRCLVVCRSIQDSKCARTTDINDILPRNIMKCDIDIRKTGRQRHVVRWHDHVPKGPVCALPRVVLCLVWCFASYGAVPWIGWCWVSAYPLALCNVKFLLEMMLSRRGFGFLLAMMPRISPLAHDVGFWFRSRL